MCGAAFLDELFERYIRGLFGDRAIDGLRPRTRVEMFAGWERVRTKFGNTNDTEFEIMIPGLPDGPHMDSGFHVIQAFVS